MNTIIVGLAVAAGTAYLIYKCRLFGRKVEVKDGSESQNRAQGGASLGPATSLSSRKIQITDEAHAARMNTLGEIMKKVGPCNELTMEATDFINYVTPVVKIFKENGDLGNMDEKFTRNLSKEEGRNREAFHRCLQLLEQCTTRLKSGVLFLTNESHRATVEQFLDCLQQAYTLEISDAKPRIEGYAVTFLDKIDGCGFKGEGQQAFFAKYEQFLSAKVKKDNAEKNSESPVSTQKKVPLPWEDES